MGESVEEYAQRFKRSARRVGNNITEIGKAGAFTRELLPAIHLMAVLGDQSTLDKAIESTRKGEISALGYARQIIPDESGNIGNRIFEDIKKEKSNKDVENLTKQMEKLVMVIQNNENNNGYRRKNLNEAKYCYNCGKRGHIKPYCPENIRYENRNDNGQNNRRNNKNYEGNYRRNDRSLNFLGTSEEDRNVRRYESSIDSDTDEYEMYPVATKTRPSLRERKDERTKNYQ